MFAYCNKVFWKAVTDLKYLPQSFTGKVALAKANVSRRAQAATCATCWAMVQKKVLRNYGSKNFWVASIPNSTQGSSNATLESRGTDAV